MTHPTPLHEDGAGHSGEGWGGTAEDEGRGRGRGALVEKQRGVEGGAADRRHAAEGEVECSASTTVGVILLIFVRQENYIDK